MSFFAIKLTTSEPKRHVDDHIHTEKEKSGCLFGRKYTKNKSDDTLKKSRPIHQEEV